MVSDAGLLFLGMTITMDLNGAVLSA